MRTLINLYLGKLLNLAGYPMIVRECTYGTKELGVTVTVKRSDLFTVVTVNGIEVFFYRISGKIDGVGYFPNETIQSANEQKASPESQSKAPQSTFGTEPFTAPTEWPENPSKTLKEKP
jgi:hypothetical protein